MESNQPNSYKFEDINEGMTLEGHYTITASVYEGFISTFKDLSPIHIDLTYALAQGFSGLVMHGAILNGFISHFLGMQFPGRTGLLLSTSL